MATTAEAAPLLAPHPPFSSPAGSPPLPPPSLVQPLTPADRVLLVDVAAAVGSAAVAAAGAVVLAVTAGQACDVPLRGWTHAVVVLLVVYCVLTVVGAFKEMGGGDNWEGGLERRRGWASAGGGGVCGWGGSWTDMDPCPRVRYVWYVGCCALPPSPPFSQLCDATLLSPSPLPPSAGA